MKTCPTCNNTCAKNAQTCTKCGHVFQPAWYSIGNDMQSVAKIVIIIISAIFLLAMIAPLFISSGSGQESVEDMQKRMEKILKFDNTEMNKSIDEANKKWEEERKAIMRKQ